MRNASNSAYFCELARWRARLAAGPGARRVGRGSRGARPGVAEPSAGGRDGVSSGTVSRDGVRPAAVVGGTVREHQGEGVHARRGDVARARAAASQLAGVDRAGRAVGDDPETRAALVRVQLTAFPSWHYSRR